MTLLEVLVALAIASIVFASVFLIYRTAAASAIRQREHERTAFAPAEALAELQRDISNLMPDGLDENCTLKLTTKDDKEFGLLSEISFCCWQADAASGEGLRADAERVAWRVEQPGTRSACIARVASRAAGPEAATAITNRFLTGIARFHLQLHDGNDWLDAWPPPKQEGEKKAVRPQTLRVELAMEGGATNWTTDFIVPIGMVFTSRVERLSLPGTIPR